MQHRLLTCFIIIIIIFFSCKKENDAPPVVTLPPPATSITYSTDEIIGFEQLALNALNVTDATIIKLPSHVYYYITDTSDALFVKQVDTVLAQINALTGINLVVERTSDSAAALAVIHYTDTTHFFASVSRASAAFHSYTYLLSGINLMLWSDSNIIYRDDIFIDKDSVQKDSLAMFELTHHELMHSIGMLGHTNLSQFGSVMFIYNLMPYVTNFTYFDKRMIQLLYNPAIKRGMNKQQVESVLANL